LSAARAIHPLDGKRSATKQAIDADKAKEVNAKSINQRTEKALFNSPPT
jgi:hypothetical protein